MFKGTAVELKDDLVLRWSRIQARVRAAGADALVVAANVNLFYVSGRVFMGHAYIPAEGEPCFFVRRPCGLKGGRVFEVRKVEQMPDILRDIGVPLPKRVMIEDDDLSHSDWARLAAVFAGSVAGNGSAVLRQCRAAKTPYEVRVMKLTGARQSEVIPRYAAVFEPGMTDQQWSVEMFRVMLRAGGLGHFRIAGYTMEGFMGTVLAGDNGGAVSPYDFALGGAGLHPSLPVGQSGVRLAEGMSVMVDIPGIFYGYITDCSRIFGVGKLAQKAYDAHQVSIDIREAIMAAGKPGVRCEDLYALAVRMAEEAGLADCFMGLAQKAKFVGHGTGIVINELPVLGARSKDVLEEGMTIALEPKFVIAGTGAVGVEDTLVVTPDGMENLTPCAPEIITL
ncbi:MAG: Xaa-Pro peptidase family protein [Kiritimatiellaeota bacterium]|nr:Xaa-Pro peptidase family protein [Kiritimatiellota bacterium]